MNCTIVAQIRFSADPNYISKRINNPHLKLINRNRVNLVNPRHPEWNDELRLFLFAQNDTTFPGYKIAVTNLDGSYYETYTIGNFKDDYPTWGPDGKTILFERREINDFSREAAKIMLIDLESGNVTAFAQPRDIKGATDLTFPDY